MKIGLTLSGGGVKGVASLGLLTALEEFGIGIHALSGTSSGALMAALYAYGYSPNEILDILKSTNFYTLIRPAFSKKGILNVEAFEPKIREHIVKNAFEALKIPLTIGVTNLNKGHTEFFSEGELLKPLLASCSVPTIFRPVKINGYDYVDGGVLQNMPAEVLQTDCDRIIGFHCNPTDGNFNESEMSWRRVLERTMLLVISTNVQVQKKYCDVFVEPELLKEIRVFDLSKFDRVFEIGYEQALKQKDELLRLLEP
jgi:NTE family protein